METIYVSHPSKHTFVFPISGGAFPCQIGILRLLLEAGIKPDICMGTSGGNLTAYLGLASEWNPYRLQEICFDINSKIFFKSWIADPLSSFLPSYAGCLNRSSMFDTNPEASKFFMNCFDNSESRIKSTEMWTGVFNGTKDKHGLFLNRNPSFYPDQFALSRMQTDEPMILKGLPLIAKGCMASIAIPIFSPSITLNGEEYHDGGLLYASPASVLAPYITDQGNHVTYINSLNFNCGKKTEQNKTLDNARYTFRRLTKGINLLDKQKLEDCMGKPKETYIYPQIDVETMREIQQHRRGYQKSLLILYPSGDEYLDITNFESRDVIKLSEKTYQNCNGELMLYNS